MSYLRFFLFGIPRIESEGHLLDIKRRRSLALAAYLALNREPQSRDTLAALLWPEYDQNTARASLRTTLWELKKIFGPDILKIEREQVVFHRDHGLWVDVNQFRNLLAECKAHAHHEDGICHTCMDALTQATGLYRDEFMAGFCLANTEPFEEWKRSQIENLGRELIRTLETLVDLYDSQEDYEQAIYYARYWLKMDPLDESAHERLMKLFQKMQQPTAALRQYEECARILAEELETEPRENIKKLYQDIKNRRSDSQAEAVQKGNGALSIPNISRPSGSCIGREKELQEIGRLLNDPSCRLITLTGLGGIGKTVLAQQALLENGEKFRQGAYFIPLIHLKSSDMIVPTVAEALKFPFPKDADPQKQLMHYIGDKKLLLLLDSYEHLLEGAELLLDFLHSAPNVKLLVTSRQRLNLKWEWVLDVQGLDYPIDETEKDIEAYGAVQLFLQSVRRVQPGFSLGEEEIPFVSRICRFLDGMPLGLELAATWARMLSCREISREIERDVGFLTTTLSDIPERHRSLQAVFDYSWQLLSEEEKIILIRLCASRGGFGKEAAEHIARVSLPLLLALMNKNFLYRNPAGRFEMLEVMRQFIKEKALQSRENLEDIQAQHADYYARFIAQKDQSAKRFMHKETLDEIHKEIENIRAGWQWSVLNKKTNLIDQYLETLFPYYELRGFYFHAEDALSKAVVVLQYSGEGQNALKGIIGKALSLQGWLNHFLAHFEKTRQLLQLSISIFERLGMKKELGRAFFRLGHVLYDTGQLDQAEDLIKKGFYLFRELHFTRGILECLKNLGNIHLIRDEYGEAKALYEQCLSAYREAGDKYAEGGVLLNSGILMEIQGHYKDAKRFYQESLACYRETEDRLRMSICYTDLGMTCLFTDQYEEAQAYLKKGLNMAMDLNALYQAQGPALGLALLRWKQQKSENVFELIGQILGDPLTHVWDRKRTEKLLEELRPYISDPPLTDLLVKGKSKGLDFYLKFYQTELKSTEFVGKT